MTCDGRNETQRDKLLSSNRRNEGRFWRNVRQLLQICRLAFESVAVMNKKPASRAQGREKAYVIPVPRQYQGPYGRQALKCPAEFSVTLEALVVFMILGPSLRDYELLVCRKQACENGLAVRLLTLSHGL